MIVTTFLHNTMSGTKMKIIFTILFLTVVFSQSLNAQWEQCRGMQGGDYINALAVSGKSFIAGTVYGLYVSRDNATSWVKMFDDEIISLTANGTEVYAGAEGVLHSVDEGLSWEEYRIPYSGSVTSLATIGSYVYAVAYGGLHMSTDKGVSWKLAGIENKRVAYCLANNDTKIMVGFRFNTVRVSTVNSTEWSTSTIELGAEIISIAVRDSIIFVGTASGKIFRGGISGYSWKKVYSGKNKIKTFLVSGNDVYAGTEKGIILSTNNGDYWHAVSEIGLTNNDVSSLVISGNVLLAGTKGGGIFKMQLNSSSVVKDDQPVQLSNNSISISPNPSSGEVHIEYRTKDSDELVELYVTDIHGMKVAELSNGSRIINTADWSEGVYMVIARTPNKIETTKLVVVR